MISRRSFLGGAGAASALAAATLDSPAGSFATPPDPTRPGVSQYVKICIGTGGHGHTYPGATVLFGMVQLSPDTNTEGWDWCSGDHYGDGSLMGFSHTHLSGTGAGDMLDVLLMPGTGSVKLESGSRDSPERGYRSRFSHEDEIAVPGYYSVLLRDYQIKAELTATARVGLHRYTFPKSDSSHFMIDLAHASNPKGAVAWAKLKLVGHDTLVGSRRVDRFAPGRVLYFAMQFSQPFRRAEIFADGREAAGRLDAEAKSLKCILHYATGAGDAILVKTGISGISEGGALANLAAEVPAWEFDQTRKAAAAEWEQELSRVRVEGGTRKQKTIFYTSLYHSLLAPTLFEDADGRYIGMDGKVHQLAPGEHNYSTFSLWDTYRAIHPLFTILQSPRVPAMVNCLIRMSHENPQGPTVWPLQGKETNCMTGHHSVVVVAEAIAKGFPGIDARAAYAPMRWKALTDAERNLDLYRKYNYIPSDLTRESIGKTMDYAYDDWAIAHVAQAAGQTSDADALILRAGNYRNIFDSRVNFVRPRLSTGEWTDPFTPTEVRSSKRWQDFTESNSWQATFAVQHDPHGLAEIMGGRKAFEARLDGLFNADSTLPDDAPVDIAGLVGQYAHGNEPSHHIAYLYVYAGVPWKTQATVRHLLDTMYDDQPDGLAGNEDCGQMSAWYVMSAMGFYAVDPVSANYVIGTPLFDRATIDLASGKTFCVEAHRPSPTAKYVRAATLNGKSLQGAWFRHSDIAAGGTLRLEMSEAPDLRFGSSPSDAPPSMSDMQMNRV